MLFRAMVTESTMDDLLNEMRSAEIKSATLCDYGGDGGRLPMIVADVPQDRLCKLVRSVQATPVMEPFPLRTYDRLVVQSHQATDGTELETAQAEICYWSYTDEELS